jgi:hypothetical protein
MTDKQTYRIHAWCDRPFIATFDVDAATPRQALEAARHAVHDAPAEECDQGYPWDEFAVYDESGNELDRVMDRPARLRVHAEDLLKALSRLCDAAGDLDAAIDGATDQFDDERRDLATAMHATTAAIAQVEGA